MSTTQPLPLTMQKQTVRDAIDVLNLREVPTDPEAANVHLATIVSLRNALADLHVLGYQAHGRGVALARVVLAGAGVTP